jgi:hypothetical protein
MLGLWKTFRGRRAAKAQIIPLLEGTRLRLGHIPHSAWHDPYVIGFLGTLITNIATRTVSSLSASDLAAVQSGAWMQITGMSGTLFGEEISFLDAAHNNRFSFGCRNADSFFHALNVASKQNEQQLGTGAAAAIAPEEVEIKSALWSRYFDAHLGEPLTAAEM